MHFIHQRTRDHQALKEQINFLGDSVKQKLIAMDVQVNEAQHRFRDAQVFLVQLSSLLHTQIPRLRKLDYEGRHWWHALTTESRDAREHRYAAEYLHGVSDLLASASLTFSLVSGP